MQKEFLLFCPRRRDTNIGANPTSFLGHRQIRFLRFLGVEPDRKQKRQRPITAYMRHYQPKLKVDTH